MDAKLNAGPLLGGFQLCFTHDPHALRVEDLACTAVIVWPRRAVFIDDSLSGADRRATLDVVNCRLRVGLLLQRPAVALPILPSTETAPAS
jgi:hypothetical protein